MIAIITKISWLDLYFQKLSPYRLLKERKLFILYLILLFFLFHLVTFCFLIQTIKKFQEFNYFLTDVAFKKTPIGWSPQNHRWTFQQVRFSGYTDRFKRATLALDKSTDISSTVRITPPLIWLKKCRVGPTNRQIIFINFMKAPLVIQIKSVYVYNKMEEKKKSCDVFQPTEGLLYTK